MAQRLRRALLARATVVAAVCALPLIAVGSAQAAIGGGHATTTANPDLVSATIKSQNSVDLCFDQALSATSGMFNASDYNKLALAGYRSDRQAIPNGVTPDTNHGGSANCATATFNLNDIGDINQYTVFEVLGQGGTNNFPGVAIAASNGNSNVSDSVPLTGSSTHNGTTGNTTAPDLTGVVVNQNATGGLPANSITYVFNKAVAAATASNFWYENGGGVVCTGTGTPSITNSATGAAVTVAFAPCSNTGGSTVILVSDAQRAGVFQGHNVVAASDHASVNPLESAIVPNTGGDTALPDLTGAVLHTDFNTVSYTFDQPLATNSINPSDFTVFMSDGAFLTGCSATIGGNNTVDVSFGVAATNTNHNGTCGGNFQSLKNEAEYAVLAAVDGTALAGVNTGTVDETGACNGSGCNQNSQDSHTAYTNSPGSAPVGDNAGAFARGFTTGADAFAVSINQNNGVVTVSLDQRVLTTTVGTDNICLYRADGTLGGCDPTVNATTFPGPGPQTVNLQFTAAQATNATALQLDGTSFLNGCFSDGSFSFITGLHGDPTDDQDRCNVPQALSPINAAAIIRAAKATHHTTHHKRHHKKHHSKKNHKRH